MKILIKQALVQDKKSPHHQELVDLFIEDGKIVQIDTNLDLTCDELISGKSLLVSPGWFDLKADFCEPGNEHKETLETGCSAAERGGFTHVCLVPSTDPPIDNKAQVEFLKNRNPF
jgi:dihydroorotase